jgi:hypothetical protein
MFMGDLEKHEFAMSFLRNYDGPCPSCGFRLKNPTSNRCPECGYELVPTLHSPNTLTSWLLFFLGLVASLGVCIDQLGLLTAAVLYQGNPISWRWALPEVILFVILSVTLVAWWKRRNWVAGLSRSARINIGVLGVALPFIVFNAVYWLFIWTL